MTRDELEHVIRAACDITNDERRPHHRSGRASDKLGPAHNSHP